MEPDKLDELLDRALGNYPLVSPMTGLEARVIKRVHANGRFRKGKALLAFACCMAVVLLTYRQTQRTQPPKPESRKSAISVPIAQLSNGPTATVKRVSHANRRTRHREMPKLAVFPTPFKLTQEERVLVSFVMHDPEGAAQAFAASRRLDEPVQIEPLKIVPLEMEGVKP